MVAITSLSRPKAVTVSYRHHISYARSIVLNGGVIFFSCQWTLNNVCRHLQLLSLELGTLIASRDAGKHPTMHGIVRNKKVIHRKELSGPKCQ